ncbi:MFS transporter [Thiomonas delicata]|uniref:Major facilitator superfamily MFS_1 n=2 Tax=Thiomonas TaxID=32012 RepID=A0A238D2V9_THIDL|nr:MFS transporter [Thiomonas delicata]SBP87591.1 Major facilitator superfamily MFS_1 [Thiomonas delicata]
MQNVESAAHRAALAGVIASNGVAAMAYGLLQPVLTIRLAHADHSDLVIGAVASAWALGIVAGSPFYARIIRRFGRKPSLLFGLFSAGMLMLLFTTTSQVMVWGLLQCIQGLAFGHFWVLSESLINTWVAPSVRGRVASLYVTVLGVCGALGPLWINVIGTGGVLPFVTCAALLGVAATPLLWMQDSETRTEEAQQPPRHAAAILMAFPGLIVLGFAAGFADHGPQSLLPPFALDMGATVHAVSLMLFAMALGRALFVVPIGILADRSSLERVLAACAATTAVLVVGVYLLWSHVWVALILWFILGALFDAFYALGMTWIGHFVPAPDLPVANTAFVVLHSLGGFGGTTLLGAVMDWWGPVGYPLAISGFAVPVALLWMQAAGRTRQRIRETDGVV